MSDKTSIDDPEFSAIVSVYTALKGLDPAAQERVIEYVCRKCGLASPTPGKASTTSSFQDRFAVDDADAAASQDHSAAQDADDGLEGVSPVARKWMVRNGLSSTQLSSLFSLGVDEIDLVAKTVPGKNRSDRMRSVTLLKGVAAYLSSGAARVTHEQIKEVSLHYDAYDPNNNAKYFKAMAAEVGGTREGGYALTARGLVAATELIKEMVQGAKGK